MDLPLGPQLEASVISSFAQQPSSNEQRIFRATTIPGQVPSDGQESSFGCGVDSLADSPSVLGLHEGLHESHNRPPEGERILPLPSASSITSIKSASSVEINIVGTPLSLTVPAASTRLSLDAVAASATGVGAAKPEQQPPATTTPMWQTCESANLGWQTSQTYPWDLDTGLTVVCETATRNLASQ